MRYDTLDDIFVDMAEMLKPPERLTVSAAAAKYRRLNNANAYVGPWKNETVPYMREPMDTFASTVYNGMIFVGPAQAGKTDGLILNTAAYSIKIDPMDTMIVCPTNTAARDFSMRRVDRLHRHSPEIGKMMLAGADADNKFDKQYITGMILSISWPTPTELAGKPVGRVILTDRDRMPDDIDGDGEPFDLAAKRTTTFGSHAMCVAESTPSRPVLDMNWIPSTLHEAPPAAGIIGLYNRGDRRRWYWPCPCCDRYFEGKFEHLKYEKEGKRSNLEIAETVRMECPHCAHQIHPDDRFDMNLWGIWVKDGQGVDADGRVFGEAPRVKIASFWLRGVAAAFVSWKDLVTMYLDANDSYEKTQSEDALKKFYNNDLGEPYYSRRHDNLRLPEELKGRAQKLGEREVPFGVRFLVALVDSQINKWVVQVFGIMPGVNRMFDIVTIDRFDVQYSKRLNEADERLWVKPHANLEDWDEITEHVLRKEYPLQDGSGRMMGIRMTGCDMGGKEGIAPMAYNYYRKLRDQNEHRRFTLLKGDPKPNNPRTRITYPDTSTKKDSKSGARGDVPVLMFNSNLLKDDLNGRLDCLAPGKGMWLFPDWLPTEFFQEMCSEVRTDKGWEHPQSAARNEAWDLSYYCIGLCISQYIRVEMLDWDNPPSWAAPWDENDLIRAAEQVSSLTNSIKSAYDFESLGKSLA